MKRAKGKNVASKIVLGKREKRVQKFWGTYRPGMGLNYFSLATTRETIKARLIPGDQIIRVVATYTIGGNRGK